jgi:hypothetical protein
MKKIGLIVFAAAVLIGVGFASFFSWGKASGEVFNFSLKIGKERGSGQMATESRSVGEFSQIDVSSIFQVEVVAQSEFSVEVEADDNLLQFIRTDVRDGRLEISLSKSVKTSNPMRVRISAPNIDRVEASGASKVNVSNLRNSQITLDTSGASKINLSGETSKLIVDVSGASSIDAGSLATGTAIIDASGASKVNVNVTSELVADASGASRITYAGSPSVNKSTSGASSVSQK